MRIGSQMCGYFEQNMQRNRWCRLMSWIPAGASVRLLLSSCSDASRPSSCSNPPASSTSKISAAICSAAQCSSLYQSYENKKPVLSQAKPRVRKHWKWTFRLPHYRLTPPLQETLSNIRINLILILPETRIIGLHFAADGRLCLSSLNLSHRLWKKRIVK